MKSKIKIKFFSFFTVILLIFVVTSIFIFIKRLIPETEASSNSTTTITVTYTAGNGTGEDVTLTQTVYDKQTQGNYDYTDNKIVLYSNGEQGIDFDGGTTTYDEHNYEMILTGWKLTAVTQDGKEITTYVEPENQNYADTSDAAKDIDTVYAQNRMVHCSRWSNSNNC